MVERPYRSLCHSEFQGCHPTEMTVIYRQYLYLVVPSTLMLLCKL